MTATCGRKTISGSVIRFAGLAACLFIALFFVSFPSDAQAKGNPRYASIVMDADTGLILHQRYADKVLHPASLTKMMTLLLAFEALERGDIRMRDRMKVSKRASGMQPSKLGLEAGETIRVEDAIYALVTKSANDVAVVLAEHLGGTESQFAQMMTRRARELGMSSTTFRNASGLHNARQVSTARDMAKLSRALIMNHPDYYHYFSTRQFTYAGRTYRNHNRLMSSYKGMDGLKTGYIGASGFNLAASAKRNNQRIIGVVFGGRTANSRNQHMAQLLDRGFSRLNEMRIAHASVPLPQRKPDIMTLASANNNIMPAAGPETLKWAALNPALSEGMIGRLIGEGDFDPAETRRFETGLMAIAAHKGEALSSGRELLAPVMVKAAVGSVGEKLARRLNAPKAQHKQGRPQKISAQQVNLTHDRWAIQIGAFASRAVTDDILRGALGTLPPELSNGRPVISPVQTGNGWLFRAQLAGYSRSEAVKACSYFNECIAVSPSGSR